MEHSCATRYNSNRFLNESDHHKRCTESNKGSLSVAGTRCLFCGYWVAAAALFCRWCTCDCFVCFKAVQIISHASPPHYLTHRTRKVSRPVSKCENSASVIPTQQLQEFSTLLVLSKEPPLTVWDQWAQIHLVLVCLCVGLASCGSSGNGANYTVWAEQPKGVLDTAVQASLSWSP